MKIRTSCCCIWHPCQPPRNVNKKLTNEKLREKMKIRTSYVAVSGTPGNPGCTVHGLTQGEVRYLQVLSTLLLILSIWSSCQKLVVGRICLQLSFLSHKLVVRWIWFVHSFPSLGTLHRPTLAGIKSDTFWRGAKGKDDFFAALSFLQSFHVNFMPPCLSLSWSFYVNSLNSFHLFLAWISCLPVWIRNDHLKWRFAENRNQVTKESEMTRVGCCC